MPYDITPMMNLYREHIRHLWTTLFQHHPFGDDAFLNFKQDLFSATVVSLIGHNLDLLLGSVTPHIIITPGNRHHPWAIALIADRIVTRETMSYNRIETKVHQDDLVIHFSGFFDWDQEIYRTWEYYEGVIAHSTTSPELVGRLILIPCNSATVYTEQLCINREEYIAYVRAIDSGYARWGLNPHLYGPLE